MKRIIYSCPFIPAEWLAAHGLHPCRILPGHGQGHDSPDTLAGLCQYARLFSNCALRESPGAIVFSTLCDQMRRMAELLGRQTSIPIFLFNVPSTWQSPAARQIYLHELVRLGRFLVTHGGVEPKQEYLSEVMKSYDRKREQLKGLRQHLSARQFSEAIVNFHRSGSIETNANPKGIEVDKLPVALLGGPMFADIFEIFDLVAQNGGDIALDATESGERTLPDRFNPTNLEDNPLDELAHAYFGTIPDVSRRPNTLLYEWLDRMIRERGIRGIIIRYNTWCDLWHAEVSRLKEHAGLPVLTLHTENTYAPGERLRTATRIEAFMDLLK
ncbi:MAG: 2-hydroxyacyl-CoA dehydratase [Planctomycetes bacterium]|nr:2-hydroxyacyl-CoA dehydratase [Planctomycetota bacterium]